MSACGDVVRNIMASPSPHHDARQARIEADARMLSEHLKPKSRAYYEIFLDEAPSGDAEEEEPLYGPTYLPRKFKVGITHEADNTIDVLTNDLGIVAKFDGDTLLGYKHRHRRRTGHDPQQRPHLSAAGDAHRFRGPKRPHPDG